MDLFGIIEQINFYSSYLKDNSRNFSLSFDSMNEMQLLLWRMHSLVKCSKTKLHDLSAKLLGQKNFTRKVIPDILIEMSKKLYCIQIQ